MGFELTCPHCGANEGISLNLNDLDSITCGSCDEAFTADDAVEMMEEKLSKWKKVAKLVKLAEKMASE